MAIGFSDEVKFLRVTIFVTLSFLIIFGNVLVMVALRHVKKFKYTTKMFIFSLSMADMFVGAILIPLRLNEICYSPWTRTIKWCQLSISVNILNLSASALNLLAISIDRLIYLRAPLHYDRIVTPRRSAATIITLWLFALSVSFIPIFSKLAIQPHADRNYEDHLCKYATTLKKEYLVYMCICDIIPLIMFAIIYYDMLKIAKQQMRKIKTQTHGAISSVALIYLKKREKRNTVMLLSLITVFYLCWIPSIIAECLSIDDGKRVSQSFIVVISILVYSNSFFNCFIYYFCNNEFRKYFRKLLRVKEKQKRSENKNLNYRLQANSVTPTTPTIFRIDTNMKPKEFNPYNYCSSPPTEIASSYF